MAYEFRLPDIGEGLTEGEIVKWLVKEGDQVREHQPLVNVLTDKAEVEIPSPKTGKIVKLLAKEGQKVAVHSVIVEIAVAGESGNGAAPARGPEPAAKAAPAAKPPAQEKPAQAQGQVLATPAVRKLAQELKVDLASVRGTGPGGRATEEDVRKAAGGAGAAEEESIPITSPPAMHGPEERVPFKGIRRRTAEKMAQSARTIPHVSHFDEADVTELVALREELKTEAAKKGVKLTYLPFIMKALVAALTEFPNLNASLDESRGEIILKRYFNIGIAVSAEHGLFVPVIRSVEKKDVWTLSKELGELSGKARDNKLGLAELQGGTFTITNIGPIGGLFATPIINHPEVGILGVMKIGPRPVVREGHVVVRSMLNLALSFDHRVLDGAEAAAFMNALVKRLESPRSLI